MAESSDGDDGATAEDETPRGAPKPDALDGRSGEDGEREIPSGVRDDEQSDQDRFGGAREDANPDQHRDEEEYD